MPSIILEFLVSIRLGRGAGFERRGARLGDSGGGLLGGGGDVRLEGGQLALCGGAPLALALEELCE